MNYAYFAGALEQALKDVPRQVRNRQKLFKKEDIETVTKTVIERMVERIKKDASTYGN